MYKNFIVTESDRREILNTLRKNGYGRPINENTDDSLDINEAEKSPVKKVINSIFRKNGIKKVVSHSSSVSGFRRYEGSGYEYNYGGSVSLHKMPEDVVKDLVRQMRDAGVKIDMVYNNGFDFNQYELSEPFSDEETDLGELDHAGFHDRDDLQVLRDAIDRNKMVSVAFVKKDGTVRHMLVRKSLKSYVGSDAEKTDAQMNVEANNDLKKVVDINAYKRELKKLRNDNPEMNPDEMKTMAAKTCWRSISLKNVLGFMVSGQFIDLRDENDIMGRFGEEVNNSLTRSMVNAMNQEVAQEEPADENEPHAPEPGLENPEEPINESLNKIRSEFKRFL